VIRVKICCISSLEEARIAVSLGASALGLVSEMPSGPGVIAEERIREIAARVPPGVSSFLLTAKTDPHEIADQHRRMGTQVLQLCDRLPGGAHDTLRRSVPEARLVQVVHVTGPESVDEACSVAARVDALLLDSGRPDAGTKELGGTGRRHDWGVSREILRVVDVPVFLAGGLDAGNVAEAIRGVRPYGVDLCSGVRTDGRLDETKLTAFMVAVRAAETEPRGANGPSAPDHPE
jgi:phosphoribosylanthranilate isomerase